MKEETSTKLDSMKDTKWEYGYTIRCAIPICVMPAFHHTVGDSSDILDY